MSYITYHKSKNQNKFLTGFSNIELHFVFKFSFTFKKNFTSKIKQDLEPFLRLLKFNKDY